MDIPREPVSVGDYALGEARECTRKSRFPAACLATRPGVVKGDDNRSFFPAQKALERR
jgi:hypothetical protein